MDAPVVGKRRVDVMSVGHLRAHPEDIYAVQLIDTCIHLSTPPFVRVFAPTVYHNTLSLGKRSGCVVLTTNYF